MKTAIITGATSGIGYETALHLANQGWKTVITWRDEQRGIETLAQIKSISGNNDVHGFHCDLSSFDSIRQAAEKILISFPVIDVLINNAGTWETKLTETGEGIETMFMVNFLAPVYLARKLQPALKASGQGHLINVSSAAHMMGRMNHEDPELRKRFRHIRAYGNSKLYILLATRWLAAEWSKDGIRANALHPGVVNTRLFDQFPSFMKGLTRLMTISARKGARTSIFLAESDESAHINGQYLSHCRVKSSSAAGRKRENIEAVAALLEKYLPAD